MTLVVVDGRGELRGQLPPFDVPTPWWQDLEPVLAAVPAAVILRLLHAEAEPDHVMGGTVTYLAQMDPPPRGLQSFTGDEGWLGDHPLRLPWARPGGPQADLDWAAEQVRVTAPPQQKRSWNLSSIWRIPTSQGGVWLKAVPPFFAHEGAVLEYLQSGPVPRLLAREGHRMLLAELPGEDGYAASTGEYRSIIDALVGLQSGPGRDIERLRAHVGVPDWRLARLRAMVDDVGRRWGGYDARPGLRALVAGWDDRSAAIAACGLPDALFHGDAHPGNARIGIDRPILFDWGDAGIGHPLLDLSVIEHYRPEDPEAGARLRRHWLAAWQEAVPASEPGRAWRLLRPIAVARAAVVFQRFLDHIEPAERVYHHNDVEPFLDEADAFVRAEWHAGGP